MKHIAILYLILGIWPYIVGQEFLESQNKETYLRQAISHLAGKELNQKKDFIIIKSYEDVHNFYLVQHFENEFVEAVNIVPPKLSITNTRIVKISFDSITDLIWISNKRWNGILNTVEEVPFEKLKGRFIDEKFNKIIRNFETAKKIDRIIEDYGKIMIVRSDNGIPVYNEHTNNYKRFAVEIEYPAIATEFNVQGLVKVGYVMTTDCSCKEFVIFKDPGYGCAQSLIKSIKEMHHKLSKDDCGNSEPIFIEISADFILQ